MAPFSTCLPLSAATVPMRFPTCSVQSILGLADNILAAASVLFLFACLSGYLALRARSADSARQWLRVADALFIVGLLAMVSIGIMLAVELL